MTKGFDQQESPSAMAFTKSAPAPQHGQKADIPAKAVSEKRSFQPRPAH
jgi:hypothetical protein